MMMIVIIINLSNDDGNVGGHDKHSVIYKNGDNKVLNGDGIE